MIVCYSLVVEYLLVMTEIRMVIIEVVQLCHHGRFPACRSPTKMRCLLLVRQTTTRQRSLLANSTYVHALCCATSSHLKGSFNSKERSKFPTIYWLTNAHPKQLTVVSISVVNMTSGLTLCLVRSVRAIAGADWISPSTMMDLVGWLVG